MLTFRLVYRGALPAASSSNGRNADKERIRRVFHPQLQELWKTHPALRMQYHNPQQQERYIKPLGAFRFLPFINPPETCELRVLFLRRDAPGGLVTQGGDIDNRMKVLLDALRRPQQLQELVDRVPQPGEEPFHVVLEDDGLVTTLNITTDRLLTPVGPGESEKDVHLVIQVIAMPRDYVTLG